MKFLIWHSVGGYGAKNKENRISELINTIHKRTMLRLMKLMLDSAKIVRYWEVSPNHQQRMACILYFPKYNLTRTNLALLLSFRIPSICSNKTDKWSKCYASQSLI